MDKLAALFATPQAQFFMFKLIGAIMLLLFLPLTAATYFFFHQPRRKFEIDRVLNILPLAPKEDLTYRRAYGVEKSVFHFLCAVTYTSVLSGIGLALLLFGHEIFGASGGEFPIIQFGPDIQFPEYGSRLICSMAFLGAYVWGLQYLFRRYNLNDLLPSVYYNLSVRMILATLVALVLYNGSEAVPVAEDVITPQVWPVLAFLIGMFPQRGLRWLTERLPMISSRTNTAVRAAPLEIIEGVESLDKVRLQELGIDTCYDLAVTDFVPLLLSTPYSARQLVDWILQAKLCIYFGETVRDLRQHGIRTITDLDLASLTEDDRNKLAAETSTTVSALHRAHMSLDNDTEIARLRQLGQELGRYTKDER